MFGLETIAPKFIVPSKRIRVLHEPSEFYSHLCNKIRSAKSRVFLASLYVGKSESELINTVFDALTHNEKLRVYILVDALRGTREAPQTCSASLIAPLASAFPNRVQVSLYQTPKLGRILSSVLPKRIVEGVGLQHMKLYGCDDEIVLSGANLSQDYFSNRQDRYISIEDSKICNWYFDLHQAVSDVSYKLKPSNDITGFQLIAPSRKQHNLACAKISNLIMPSSFAGNAVSSVQKITELGVDQADLDDSAEVYPLCQFTPLKIGNELEAMRLITGQVKSSKYKCFFTAGYFNVEPSLAENLSKSTAECQVVVAAPEANGFFQSKGISGKIPMFYSMLAFKFLSTLPSQSKVILREWQRGVVNQPGGWSYHAKGIWLVPNQIEGDNVKDKNSPDRDGSSSKSSFPILTYIGSSNFTRRSYLHDLECGAILVAKGSNNSLRKQFQNETDNITQFCGPAVTTDKFKQPEPTPTWKDRLLLRILGSRL